MSKNPSDFIRERRDALGLSQQEAANIAEMSVSGWQVIERGIIKNPTFKTAQGIARALNCSLADIWPEWAK